MKKLFGGLAVLTLIGGAALAFALLRSDGLTVSIPESDLQAKVDGKFPQTRELEDDKGQVLLHSPQLTLRSNRIHVTVEGELHPKKRPAQQRRAERKLKREARRAHRQGVAASGDEGLPFLAELSGRVRYDRAQAALFFDDPKLERFESEKLPEGLRARIEERATATLEERMTAEPLRTLDGEDARSDLARLLLKRVEVREKSLHLVFGLE